MIQLTSVSEKIIIMSAARSDNVTLLPYRITDTGVLIEKIKAIERRWIQELGTKARRNLWEMPCLLLI